MDDLRRARLNMFKRVNFFLGDQAASFAAYVLVATKKAELLAIIVSTELADTTATADNTGYAEQKNDLRYNVMTPMFLKISRGLTAHYFNTNDFVNRKLYDFNSSEIEKMTDGEFDEKAKFISTRATALAAPLLLLGVTALNISGFASNCTTFDTYQPQPLQKRDETSAYTDEVARLLGTADPVLASLDINCALVATDFPVVYGEYKQTRKIVSLGGGSGTQTFEEPLATSEIKIICEIAYSASRQMQFFNQGSASSIKFFFTDMINSHRICDRGCSGILPDFSSGRYKRNTRQRLAKPCGLAV